MNYFDINTHPFTSQLRNVKPSGKNKWVASCPCGQNHANNDQEPSLFIGYDPTRGTIGIQCLKGCSKPDILASVGCSWTDLFTNSDNSKNLLKEIQYIENTQGLTYVEHYDYSYPYNDNLIKIKFLKSNKKKTFKWIHLTDKGYYTLGRNGFKNRLFVSGNMKDDIIILVEGEKDSITVHKTTGITAVSSENGATTGRDDNKWTDEYTKQLTGKKVYILYDNDDAGRNFANLEACHLYGKASEVKIMNLPSVWNNCPAKADISDYTVTFGSDKAKETINYLMNSEPVFVPNNQQLELIHRKEQTIEGITIKQAVKVQPVNKTIEKNNPGSAVPSLPEWITETTYNGRTVRKLNEPLFCEGFKDRYKVAKINNVFYFKGKQVSDEFVMAKIQSELTPYFTEKTGRKANDVFITLSNYCFTQQPIPDEHKIYCADDTTIIVSEDGDFTVTKEDVFTLTRLSAKYDPEAQCPKFLQYLSDLFYGEDIPVIQEYMGYCLIPCTRAQAGLFLHGKGGEGKSVLRDVIMSLFGHSAIQEGIHHLGDRFVMTNLENRLVCVDDDMKTSLLSDTNTLKQLITNSIDKPIQVERKNKQKHDAFIYARVFAIGNSFIGSKFDHSDGFYRRQLLIDCRPKTRTEEEDDRFMGEKVCKEINGIFNFALDGLKRLIRHGYHFTESERIKRTLDDVKHEGDNTLTFMEDDSVILVNEEWHDSISSADLFSAYVLWCHDNGETPIKRSSFCKRVSERYKLYKVRIATGSERVQGYTHMKFTDTMQKRIDYMDEKITERINRMP